MYRDMSGESLHRRGYRDAAIHRAALNESAAAGVLSLAGYAKCCDNARGPNAVPLPALVDPMCGSGDDLNRSRAHGRARRARADSRGRRRAPTVERDARRPIRRRLRV